MCIHTNMNINVSVNAMKLSAKPGRFLPYRHLDPKPLGDEWLLAMAQSTQVQGQGL